MTPRIPAFVWVPAAFFALCVLLGIASGAICCRDIDTGRSRTGSRKAVRVLCLTALILVATEFGPPIWRASVARGLAAIEAPDVPMERSGGHGR